MLSNPRSGAEAGDRPAKHNDHPRRHSGEKPYSGVLTLSIVLYCLLALTSLAPVLQAAGDHVAVVGAAGGVGQILTAKLLEVRAGVSRPCDTPLTARPLSQS